MKEKKSKAKLDKPMVQYDNLFITTSTIFHHLEEFMPRELISNVSNDDG